MSNIFDDESERFKTFEFEELKEWSGSRERYDNYFGVHFKQSRKA